MIQQICGGGGLVLNISQSGSLKENAKKELRRTKVNRQIRRSIETNSDHIDLTMSANDLTR